MTHTNDTGEGSEEEETGDAFGEQRGGRGGDGGSSATAAATAAAQAHSAGPDKAAPAVHTGE